MGQWRDQDGYLVDQDYDDYADPPRGRSSHRCVCDPTHQWPGTCPGPDHCPLNQPDPPEDTADETEED